MKKLFFLFYKKKKKDIKIKGRYQTSNSNSELPSNWKGIWKSFSAETNHIPILYWNPKQNQINHFQLNPKTHNSKRKKETK
jgi:hypothetical protein